MANVYPQLSIASWQVGDAARIRFPLLDLTDLKQNRVVAHERPYREGAKLDDTGAKVREFTMRAQFANAIREPGLENNPSPLFPEMLRLLQESFDNHETGRLEVPTLGVVYCKAVSCRRHDSPENPDGPMVDLVFHEDNEDGFDRAKLDPPTVKGSIPRLAQQTVFSAQASGAWDDNLASLTQTVNSLESALNAPGRATNEVAGQARRNRRAQKRLVKIQQQVATAHDRPFTQPAGSQTERQLLTLRDRQAEAAGERARSLPTTMAFTVDVNETNIFEIAARFNSDVVELLDLNDALIPNPFLLRRGQVIRVFVRART